jgi:hypothetical protein
MNVTLTLSQDQSHQLLQLADAALRGGGLQYARQAASLMDLLDAAAAASQAPPSPQEPGQ